MNFESTNSRQLNIVGNYSSAKSGRDFLGAALKEWGQKVGRYSVFAAVPALLTSYLPVAHSEASEKTDASVAEQWPKRFEKLNFEGSNPALLKRQSEFGLPHQDKNLDLMAGLGGTDNCPGRPIPGGKYTAAVPFTDAGDTTNANNTVGRIHYYYYYSFDTNGPDHIYTFTLTSRGPNPQIRVSATTPGYRPLIYILRGGASDSCPAGTENIAVNVMLSAGSDQSGHVTVDSQAMGFLPLNVPLHLFIDSNATGSAGRGSYTIRMQDVTIPSSSCPNPIDCPDFFVRQHYSDFLIREPDLEGLGFWTNEITSCTTPECAELKRINVSGAFFLSIEFQEAGYLVYRMYKAAYGDLPQAPVPLTQQEFLPDTRQVGQGVVVGRSGWQQQLLSNKNAFASEFVSRSRFTNAFPTGMSAAQFVDTLNANAEGPLSQSERDQLVNELASGMKTRAQILRAVAEDADFARSQFNKAFVLMQYFGYLHRNPNDAPDNNFDGYNFWLAKLNVFDGNFVEAEMVKAFISSNEYRRRFAS